MLRHIVESKKGYFYAEQYMENLDPNTFSHCATFKMTLLYMCRLESSPIYIRPAFFEALLKYIKDETTYEFFLNRQGLSTRLTSESNMSYADPKIGGHIKDINLYNYRWESGKLYALLNIEGSSTPLLFTPSSGVTKTTDIVEEFYIELSKKHSYRKNYAEVPRSPEAKTPTFLSTDRDSIYPVIAYKGECNLLKINSKLNAHAFLLHVFTNGTLMDSALLKNKSGEAGLFMYINNDEVEFIYIDINGTPCLVSLAEAWWILSL
jgi:hypothetical protein